MTLAQQLTILFILLVVLAVAILFWQTPVLLPLVLPMPATEGS